MFFYFNICRYLVNKAVYVISLVYALFAYSNVLFSFFFTIRLQLATVRTCYMPSCPVHLSIHWLYTLVWTKQTEMEMDGARTAANIEHRNALLNLAAMVTRRKYMVEVQKKLATSDLSLIRTEIPSTRFDIFCTSNLSAKEAPEYTQFYSPSNVRDIHSFIHFAQQVTHVLKKKHIKTYCKVSWTIRQCIYCCPW